MPTPPSSALTFDEAARRLADVHAQLEAIFDNVPIGIAVYDRDFRIIRLNEQMARWNGLDHNAVVGRLASEVFVTWPSGLAVRERALAGESGRIEVDRRAGGQQLGPAYVLASYTPVVVNGEVIGITVSSTDITDTVQRSRALEEAYAQLQAVFDNVQVGIAVYDRDFRIVRMNNTIAHWNGVTPESATGSLAADVHGGPWRLAADATRRALAGEQTSIELDQRAAGMAMGPAHVLAAYSPVRVGGEVIGITVSSTDITDRVEAAHRADVAIQFRDDLLSIASHELRTPLTSIIGFSQRLERIAEHEDAPSLHAAIEDLGLIRGESERMARTLDLLLDLVGLAAGAANFEHEPVALTPLLRRQMRMVRERHPALHVDEEFAGDVLLDSDADRIAQVVSNLLENAAKYAGETASVYVRTRERGKHVIVEVEDNGPGIPLEQQSSVFERRYRGHSVGGTGLGLGLYLSRVIALRLGGSLTLRSVPGEGATFILALPAARKV